MPLWERDGKIKALQLNLTTAFLEKQISVNSSVKEPEILYTIRSLKTIVYFL
jgi:hypothetical protein